jgi:hypothetical protein
VLYLARKPSWIPSLVIIFLPSQSAEVDPEMYTSPLLGSTATASVYVFPPAPQSQYLATPDSGSPNVATSQGLNSEPNYSISGGGGVVTLQVALPAMALYLHRVRAALQSRTFPVQVQLLPSVAHPSVQGPPGLPIWVLQSFVPLAEYLIIQPFVYAPEAQDPVGDVVSPGRVPMVMLLPHATDR